MNRGVQSICTEHGGQGLGSIKKFGGGDGIGPFSINGDIDKGLLEGIDDGTAGRDGRSRHCKIWMSGCGCRFG